MSTAIALSSLPVLLQLVQREEYRGRPAELEESLGQGALPGIDASELPLVAAAAALNVGDAKRALRALERHAYDSGSDAAIVAAALTNLANALDRNWFPGGAGAVLEEGDIGRIAGEPPAAASAAPPVQLLVIVTRDVVAMAPVWRNIVDNARRSGQTAAVDTVIAQVAGVGQRLQAYGAPLPVAYLSLIHADLLWRAGQWQAVSPLHTWAFQTYQAAGDVVGVGACWLVKGDWAATPESHPELLGLSLDTPIAPGTAVIDPDPATARTCYEQAKACFQTAGATRGLAAVELRLAYLDGGDHLDTAHKLALESGDTSLEQLASVHRALATPEIDLDAVGSAVAEWAQDAGSYSYARGLARLCLADARHLRESGEILRGRAPLRVADAINSGIGAVLEPALVSGEYAQLYGGANYRRAMLVLTELDLEAKIAAAAADDPLAWLSLVDGSMQASATAIGLRDPDAIERGAQRLERVLALSPAPPSAAVTFTAGIARSTVAQAAVLAPLYRGTQAREDGRSDDAERLFDEAQKAADGAGDDVLRLVVLATRRRRDEGLQLCRELVAAAKVPPDFAAELLQRLGAAAEAKEQLAKVEAMGAPAPSARPWERLVLPAEIDESLGDSDDAAALSTRGVQEFEEHLARLSRDVLRLSAMDDVNVVSLYTTAVRAELARKELDASFRMSDRCRGIALADLLATDSAAGTSADVVGAVRGWHREGVKLAGLFEQIRWEGADDAAGVRGRIAEAERSLDDAEARLDAVAPSLLRARREPPPTPSLEGIQELLRPDSVLLQYHFFDDELIGWAVTRDGMRAARMPGLPALAGEASCLLRACADRSSSAGERAGIAARLAKMVLEPFEPELEANARVVVVPHARMGLVPFHLLPFAGDALGVKRTVSYLPASSVAPRWHGHAKPRLGPDAVVVGDPAYAEDRKLPRLHGARAEALEVARLLGATALVDGNATAAAVSTAIGGARAAHLATHGLVPQASPNSAQLALAGDDSLTIADLMGLDTELDLAVLSACDTGRGSATAGGDVIGLTRALLAAGARDVVVSLWPVDDVAGCLTMVDFYGELIEHGDVAAALAAAETRVRSESLEERKTRFAKLAENPSTDASREWGGAAGRAPAGLDPAHPYFWGPFVHIGL
ncbi:MAG TPA: CHAT domain-containing protein [Gaiellaceae bacterium]|nr:CHAT domain-containing protein [Gaiellaceae bacterium]